MSVKLLTEHHLEFLSFKGGITCSSESTLVKLPHCWKSCVAAQLSQNQDQTRNPKTHWGRTSGLPGAVYDVRLNLNVLLVK